jgi:crotonobetainyl-CoA:carnitine CoA-transferase CaiB-like acyl-CoA transferase
VTGALAGLRVIDCSTVFAGPMAAQHLGDLGADVIKVEHPRRPDPARGHGPERDGQNLWWKTLGRNKRTVRISLSTPGGAAVFADLAAVSDVVIENFRPGTLERWGLSYEALSERNPGLVLARVTGFGQTGPYASRPGFGTLAEAMSGFAALTGDESGPPLLPAFGLADGIASYAVAYGIMAAIHQRHATGRGQVVDVSILEPIMSVLGPQITRWDQLGTLQPRLGNRSSNNAPRNIYRTSDGRWLAVSTSTLSIAERVMRLVGRDDLTREPWFGTGHGRAQHWAELDGPVAAWIAGHTAAEVTTAFEAAEAAIAPVYTAADLVADPHLLERGVITWIDDPDLGRMAMQAPAVRLSKGDAPMRFPGRAPGADTDAVLAELGYDGERIGGLRESGDVA